MCLTVTIIRNEIILKKEELKDSETLRRVTEQYLTLNNINGSQNVRLSFLTLLCFCSKKLVSQII